MLSYFELYIYPSFLSDSSVAVAIANRTTTPYMTKYERARVLGTRALQIRSARNGTLRIKCQLISYLIVIVASS